ncbi:SCO family protein [Paenibacillus chartarius]|uniref:SCO family protein n=1 Tax=Paenibacillus chartarius TaxID=747481 RepID=A0ABV6DF07_9BACL
MNAFMKKNWFNVAVIVILLAMIGSFGYKLWFSDAAAAGKGTQLEKIKAAPDFELQDLSGAKVTKADAAGKAGLYYFFYSSCPDVCQPTSFLLSQVQEELKKQNLFGSKALIHSITVDPTVDTAQKLTQFSAQFNTDPSGWKFLRGEEKQTAELAEKFGVMVVKDKGAATFTHSNVILLVDKHGDLRTYYNASDVNLTAKTIVKDMQTLIKEK